MAAETIDRALRLEVRHRSSYPSDDLGFLQRTHSLRGQAFGQLIYMADSVMLPMERPGFGMHPHVNVEVVSYVVDGTLTHRDSTGNVGTVPAGGFQVITAGTGIEHDESNQTDRPLRMFQIWFAPRLLNVAPTYATIETTGRVTAGKLLPAVGPGGLGINADASIALGRLESGQRQDLAIGADRATMIYIVEGEARIGDVILGRQDQLRVTGPAKLTVAATAPTDLLVIESGL